MHVQEKLRNAARQLRTRPMPLADLIPLLTEAADKIDDLIIEVIEAHERLGEI